MAYQTSLAKLDDEELLAKLDDKRAFSPIIEELCQRLEKNAGLPVIASDAECEKACPVCEATLSVDYDLSIEQFTLKIQRP